MIPPIPIENSPIQVEFELSSTVFQGKGGTVTGSLGGQATIAPFSGGQVVGGMISFTAPKAGIFPLILTYSEPSAPNIAQGSHPLPVAARFLVQLDSCTINRTRALQNDTDFAAISACTDRDPPQSQSKFLGDLQSGNTAHPIGLTLGPFDIVPGSQDALCFSFTIINSGFAGSAQQKTQDALNKISDATKEALDKQYPALAIIWTVVNKITQFLNGIFAANCDGLVAGDKVILTSVDLDQKTTTSGRYINPPAMYPGSPSNPGCGATSEYVVNWSVVRTSH